MPTPGPLGYVASDFKHTQGIAEVHYYPPRSDKTPKDIIIFFPGTPSLCSLCTGLKSSYLLLITGNPGLVSYYTPFLLRLQSHLSPHYAFLAHSHIGHSPSLPHPTTPLKLYEQVDSKVEFVKALTKELVELRRREGGEEGEDRPVRISFIGHSVGSEIAVQTMRQLDDHLETSLSTFDNNPDEVDHPARFKMNASFLLFPTISHIALTPNGQKLRPIFAAPLIHLLPALCYLIHPIVQILRFALSFVSASTSPMGTTVNTTTSIYAPNSTTLHFLSSPQTVKHVLNLAKSEMISITEPDLEWYAINKSRLWSYWGKQDGWVGKQGDEVKRVLRGGDRVVVEEQEGRVVDCVDNIPHAFCLGKSVIVADQTCCDNG